MFVFIVFPHTQNDSKALSINATNKNELLLYHILYTNVNKIVEIEISWTKETETGMEKEHQN